MSRRRKLLIAGAAAASCAVLLVAVPTLMMRLDTRGERSTDPHTLPHREVAIVLGAGLTPRGTPTLFLRDRLDGAIELYQLGKVDGLLMTGDNSTRSYDEPSAMRDYALDHGVPLGAITLDFAGFNTYDSCVRAHTIFSVTGAIVVTQSYHLPRAVYLCRSAGIDAVGLGMPDWGRIPDGQMAGYQGREVLASVKAMWDADVRRPDPRFLGHPVPLNLQPFTGSVG
jgi:vancomycin permeability regulator SanA